MAETLLRERLGDLESFFEQKGFTTLARSTQRVISDIEERYAKIGKPMGDGNALEWFEQQFLTWKYRADIQEPTLQEEVTKAFYEAEAMGDGFMRDGHFVRNTKAVARRVALMSNRIVTNADNEGRGLHDLESYELEYTLTDALADLREINEREKAS